MKFYLVTYNFLQFIGWTSLVARAILHGSFEIYKEPSLTMHLKLVQISMLIEVKFMQIVHSVLRISPSPFLPTFLQTAGRAVVIYGAMEVAPESFWNYMVILMWGSSEIIRYFNYLYTELFGPSSTVTWIRYTAFIPLYPFGFSSEIMVYYHAYSRFSACCPRLNSFTMPNEFNFSFDFFYFFWILIVPGYILGCPFLYFYMIQQRQKKLKIE